MISDVLEEEKYLNIITSEHRMKEKYVSFVSSILKPLFDTAECISNNEYFFDLEFAIGDQLDIIGEIIGIERRVDFVLDDGTQVLNDDDYRFLIKATIARNHWDGSRENIYEIWNNLFPNVRLNLIDNLDMSCLIIVMSEGMTKNQISMLFEGLIVPRPAGVQYVYMFGENAIFAFDMDNEFFKGWDQGYWVAY